MVLVCFFLSGLTGLAYQILWTRMLGNLIGNSPLAVSIMLTIFMGGLGVGSLVGGILIDRVRESSRLVMFYGLLELCIGAYALLLPKLLSSSEPLYAAVYHHASSHFLWYNFLTLLFCLFVVGLPVVCMGATLPVLCRFFVLRLSHLGQRVGLLYGLNTLGAALGALLCGFWLIAVVGMGGGLLLVASLNLAIALICLLIAWVWRSSISAPSAEPQSRTKGCRTDMRAEVPAPSPFQLRMALLIFAVSGFCAMSYEVIWTRLLSLIIGPTTFSMTIVVVSFVLGLGVGSLLLGRWADRAGSVFELLVALQIVAALAALAISHLMGNSQLLFAKLMYVLQGEFAWLHWFKGALVFGLLIVPTACVGATFPLVGKLQTQSIFKVGRSLSFAYTVNTIGAVLGSFCAGFVLMPFLGQESGLKIVIGLQLGTALFAGAGSLARKSADWGRLAPWLGAALLGTILCLIFPRWDRRLFAEGRYHRFDPRIIERGWWESILRGSEILSHYTKDKLVWQGEGIGGFTTVLQSADALGNLEQVLLVSGKGDASSRADMMTQCLLAHFPMLYHKRAQSVMVLGLASGITAGEVLHYPVDTLDIVEINPQMVTASSFFRPWNNEVLSNPKTDLILQDGRAHLLLTKRDYDVIISEPSNPWMAGLASLFTRDFFAQARSRLKAEGIFVQFLHSYQMDWPTFAMVCRTFEQVFPNNLLVTTLPSARAASHEDYLLVGIKGDNRLDLQNAQRNLAYAQLSQNVSVLNPAVFHPLIVSENLRELVGPGPIHTDDRPLLEFAAPRVMYHTAQDIRKAIQTRAKRRPETEQIVRQISKDIDAQLDLAAYALSVYLPFPRMVDLANATAGQRERYASLIKKYVARNPINYSLIDDEVPRQTCRRIQIEVLEKEAATMPDPVLSWLYLSSLFQAEGRRDQAIAAGREALKLNPASVEAHQQLGNLFMQGNNAKEAVAHFELALKITPDASETQNELGIALIELGRFEEAINQFNDLLRRRPQSVNAHVNLGIALSKVNRTRDAILHYEQALQVRPDVPEVHNNLGVALRAAGERDRAVQHFQKALQLKPDYLEAQRNLAETLPSSSR